MTITEAVTRLEAVYESAADLATTYAELEAGISEVVTAFNVVDLKAVCRGFQLNANLTSKKVMRAKIARKILNRKASVERGAVIDRMHRESLAAWAKLNAEEEIADAVAAD